MNNMDNNNKNIQEQIDRYLIGDMDHTEKIAFEEKLKNDPKLQEDVKLSKHIINAFHHENEQAAFKAMKSMSEEDIRRIISSSQPVRKGQKRSFALRLSVAVAAAACLLLILGIRPKYSSEHLLTSYYVTQPYESYPSRGDSELPIEERMQLRQAKKLYEQKEYPQALAIYESFFRNTSDWKSLPEEIIFHSAICQFETGEVSGPIEKLSYLSLSDQSEFKEEALWNLSFVYLKDNQRKKAKECLQKLIDKDGIYAAKAKELKDKLDKRFLF